MDAMFKEAKMGAKNVRFLYFCPPLFAFSAPICHRLRDDSFDVHDAKFQDRVVRPKGDKPSSKPFYLELTARTSLLNPVASLVRRIGQRPKKTEQVLSFSFAASGEKINHRIVRRENIPGIHWPPAASR
jgi:hypothetical protein